MQTVPVPAPRSGGKEAVPSRAHSHRWHHRGCDCADHHIRHPRRRRFHRAHAHPSARGGAKFARRVHRRGRHRCPGYYESLLSDIAAMAHTETRVITPDDSKRVQASAEDLSVNPNLPSEWRNILLLGLRWAHGDRIRPHGRDDDLLDQHHHRRGEAVQRDARYGGGNPRSRPVQDQFRQFLGRPVAGGEAGERVL